MTWTARPLILLTAVSFLLLTLGFVLFASSVTRTPEAVVARADGIVVLTGPDRRIDAALKLLRDGFGRRLLISGINPRTSPNDILRNVVHGKASPPCCIDFGYEAQDTIGNANETKDWADRNHFTRLIVVTSSYHMPRSLAELKLVLPDTELIAAPVVPPSMSEGPWWLRPSVARILAGEYLKLLPSFARYAMHRALAWPTISVARPAKRPSDARSAGLQ